jgi:two-component system sensor histidine kinase GlrK
LGIDPNVMDATGSPENQEGSRAIPGSREAASRPVAALPDATRTKFGGILSPRSFLGLLTTGFILVALPLCAALVYSAWSTDQLAKRGTGAVLRAAQAARASRLMADRISTIARLAQQMAVISDAELLPSYRQLHESFKRAAGHLAALPMNAEQLSALKRTVAGEQALYRLLRDTPLAQLSARDIRTRVDTLTENAYEVLAVSYLVADREVERLRSNAEIVQRRLVMLMMFSTALALGVALALTRIIARPFAQLDAAIRQLGDGEFAHPIRVRGPQDLHQLGGRLDWLRHRLSELEAQENRFLRHLSQELKTPLRALRVGAELLNDRGTGPLTQLQQQVVAIVRDNGLKLQRMIEKLLDYQGALHAAAALDARPLRLDVLVRDVADAHRLAARAKGQRVVLETTALSIEADGPKLRSIVDNLLSNAVKFAPPDGTISVLAGIEGGDVVIEVIDSGPGVPVEERELIFDSFTRGHAQASGRVEGTGLGLAIVREFAEAHGGRAMAVSGSRGGHFRVTLPCRAVRAADAA